MPAKTVFVIALLCACARPEVGPDFHDTSVTDSGTARVVPPVPVLTAIETSRDGDVERVVFTFRGTASPTYSAAYLTGAPEGCGSGQPIPIAGTSVLSIRFTPTDAHEFVGERARSSIPKREIDVDFPIIRQVKLTCDFEADVTAALGVSARGPFRVSRLANPTRVVLEIR